MSLLVVGSVAFDAIETPHGSVQRTIGGAATYFALAAGFFTRVNLVGVVGDDFTTKDEAVFHGRRIDLTGLERVRGKSFFWAGRYSADMNERKTLTTELNVFADFKPKLPPEYCSSRYVFLANIDPTLQYSVLKQIKGKPRIVALDTMNYWIERTPAELRNVLEHTDVLMINDSEARQISGQYNLLKAAAEIRRMGPQTLVIKRGEYGAMMAHKKDLFWVPGFPLLEVRDPTGAGDSFAGGFMGYLASAGGLNQHTLRRAMVYGSVLGSFAVERFGIDRLRTLTKREVTQRAKLFLKLTRFQL